MKTFIKSQVASRKSQVASRKSQVASRFWSDISVIFKHSVRIVLLSLFVIPLFFISNSKAQGDCTDGIHTYKVITGASKTVTTAISEGLLLPTEQAQTTPQFIKLEGELVINIDYHFAENSDIIGTNTSSSISISYNRILNITGTSIHGCNCLMPRIFVPGNTTLNLSNSNLFNMTNAIYVGGENVTLNLYNNEFNNNSNSIYVWRAKNLVTEIVGNTFDGGIVQGSQSTAIILEGADNFNVGNGNVFYNYANNGLPSKAFIQLTNEFSFGNCKYDFNGCRFLNSYSEINYTSSQEKGDELYFNNCEFSDTKVNCDGLEFLSIYNNCTFLSNFSSGALVKFIFGNSLYITSSDIIADFGAESTAVDAIEVKSSNNIYINNNNFDYCRFGVRVEDCFNLRGSIHNNVITHNDWAGIRILNSISNNFVIDYNNIQSDLIGISCANTENFLIDNNSITTLGDIIGGEGGIEVAISGRTVISDNSLYGNNFHHNVFSEGIGLEDTPFTEVICNNINDYNKSIFTLTDSEPSSLTHNELRNYPEGGIVFNGQLGGKVGPQIKKGNMFLDQEPRYDELIDPQQGSPFYITQLSPQQMNILVPNPHIGEVIIVGGPPSPAEYSLQTFCGAHAHPNPDLVTVEEVSDEWIRVMTDTTSTDDCDTIVLRKKVGEIFTQKYNIFTSLFFNPNLKREIPIAEQFWNRNVNAPLGKLFFAANEMSNMANKQEALSIRNSINEIDVTKQYESNLKTVLKYKITAMIENREWTDNEKNELESIALQCYKCGGKGVKIARALLGKNRWDYNDTLICEKILQPRSKMESSGLKLDIFPNPNKGVFDITLPANFKSANIIIYNSLGQIVFDKSIGAGEKSANIALNQDSGIYFVNLIIDNNNTYSNKIVIVN